MILAFLLNFYSTRIFCLPCHKNKTKFESLGLKYCSWNNVCIIKNKLCANKSNCVEVGQSKVKTTKCMACFLSKVDVLLRS